MKKILLIFCFLLLLKGIRGQDNGIIMNNFEAKYRDEAISNSTFVFEGSIIKQSAYIRDNKCIKSNIVEIKRVLRGFLKVGTV